MATINKLSVNQLSGITSNHMNLGTQLNVNSNGSMNFNNNEYSFNIQNEHDMKLDEYDLYSSFHDKEVFVMLETVKKILIDKRIVTRDEFDKYYDKTQERIQNKIDAYKVMNKLSEEP